MKSNKSIQDICRILFDLETEYNLLNFEIWGVKIWQAIRVQLFFMFATEMGVLDEPHMVMGSVFKRLKNLKSFIISCIIYNPFLDITKKKTLIFDHTRKVLVDGAYIDIYTEYLIRELSSRGEKIEILEGPHFDRHLSNPSKNRKHTDMILIMSNFVASFFPVLFSKAEKTAIETIQNTLSEKMGISFDLKKVFSREIVKFKVRYSLIKFLLKIQRPEKIYIVVAYGHPYIVKAAKDLGIRIVELQHGVISDYHLGYSYPNVEKESLDYFPHEIHLWEEFWKKMCTYPLRDENIKIFPFEHLLRQGKKFIDNEKNPKQILVLSQGTIGPRLAGFILKNIEELHDYRLIYKLHPSEYERWTDYPDLVKLKSYGNVSIIDNNTISLYELMAHSRYLVGVYSTAVFESLYFKCSVILVDLPGIEYMTKLIESGKAVLCTEKDSLIGVIKGITDKTL